MRATGRNIGPWAGRAVGLLVAAALPLESALGWGARGHRLITYLALDGLPSDVPGWMREAAFRNEVAYQSSEADRWRGTSTPPLGHENKPDHYLDVEDLERFGLKLDRVSPFRAEYLRALVLAKQADPDRAGAYDAAKDPERTKEWPGFLLHAMAEHYAKLVACFRTLRTLEQLNDPARGDERRMARANVAYHMGMLSHFVGDAAQPLHTTRHHNGWVGDNPGGYTTDKRFHSYIDDGVIRDQSISYESLRPATRDVRPVDASNPWKDLVAHVSRSFEQVEPLYKLEKSGELKGPAGRVFIEDRLCDGAGMLSALYGAAWRESAPSKKDVEDFLKYSDFPGGIPLASGGAGR